MCLEIARNCYSAWSIKAQQCINIFISFCLKQKLRLGITWALWQVGKWNVLELGCHMVWAHSRSLGRVMHRPVLLNQSDFAPEGHLVMSRDIIGCHEREWVGVLASSKSRPGMLSDILLCTGQFLPAKSYLAPNVAGAKATGYTQPPSVSFIAFPPHFLAELPSLPMNSFVFSESLFFWSK